MTSDDNNAKNKQLSTLTWIAIIAGIIAVVGLIGAVGGVAGAFSLRRYGNSLRNRVSEAMIYQDLDGSTVVDI